MEHNLKEVTILEETRSECYISFLIERHERTTGHNGAAINRHAHETPDARYHLHCCARSYFCASLQRLFRRLPRRCLKAWRFFFPPPALAHCRKYCTRQLADMRQEPARLAPKCTLTTKGASAAILAATSRTRAATGG